MGIIQLLDTVTTNKIAAGEVVADPASVVKELMENSLDAGSTRITVEIFSGGVESIKVADNGWGIAPEDMEIAFMRHATSKIRTFHDLDTVATMGFRGEALASIGAVSRVTMTSRAGGRDTGFRLSLEAGLPAGKPIPIGCAEGTTVEVADLFYNVPARKKFLKSMGRETAAVNEIVSRLALGHPHTAIKLKNDGKTIFETYGNDNLLSDIGAVLGQDIAEHLIPVNSASEDWKIFGFVSIPFYTRSSRKSQYFYINKRWVSNQGMRYSLDHAFRSMIPKGRYPIAVLFLETAKPLVDVNVDPTKNTVRINNGKKVHDFIVASVRDALSENKRGKDITVNRNSLSGTSPTQAASIASVYLPQKSRVTQPVNESLENMPPDIPDGGLYSGEHAAEAATRDYYSPEATGEMYYMPFKIIGQLAESYILYEKGRNLYIVDQHAAHERIRFETILNKAVPEGKQLVIPQTISLSPRQLSMVEQLSENLEEAGFQFEFFGGSSIVLREVPLELSFNNPEAIFLDLVDLTEDNLGDFKDLKEAFMFSLACKTAVKAGQVLSEEEMKEIVEGLHECQDPFTCPHGRPTTICISEKKLLKEFKRV